MHSPACFCPQCGSQNAIAFKFCSRCGAELPTSSIILQPAPQQVYVTVSQPRNRGVYIVLGLFFGGLGIHNFYAGRIGPAVAQLLIMVFTFWLILPIFAIGIWVLIELFVVNTDGRGIRMV